MEADRERVRADSGERRQLGGDPADSDEPHESERARGDRPDLEAVDGEAVIETGCAEAREQRVAETLRASEHHRLDERTALPVEAVRGVCGEPTLQPVSDAADPAATAHDAPLLHAQHDVHALPAQPRRLVEAMRRPAR